MDTRYPSSGIQGSDQPRSIACAEFEALLVDALDGTLSARDAAAFNTHRESCLACAQLLEEARRGGEWLHFLENEPEVPADLVARILAGTSGTSEPLPVIPTAAGGAAIHVSSWQTGWLPGLERHAAQSRWMMTAAMAFFSIAFTLNLTGVRLTDFRLSDLKPTAIADSLTRQFYVADAHVMRYYDNLRFVYELESRVREIRGDNQPASKPVNTAPQAPRQQPKKDGGSARQVSPGSDNATPVAALGEPVLASFTPTHEPALSSRSTHKTKDRAERSLA